MLVSLGKKFSSTQNNTFKVCYYNIKTSRITLMIFYANFYNVLIAFFFNCFYERIWNLSNGKIIKKLVSLKNEIETIYIIDKTKWLLKYK